jgi:hypothetical protein
MNSPFPMPINIWSGETGRLLRLQPAPIMPSRQANTAAWVMALLAEAGLGAMNVDTGSRRSSRFEGIDHDQAVDPGKVIHIMSHQGKTMHECGCRY